MGVRGTVAGRRDRQASKVGRTVSAATRAKRNRMQEPTEPAGTGGSLRDGAGLGALRPAPRPQGISSFLAAGLASPHRSEPEAGPYPSFPVRSAGSVDSVAVFVV